MRVVETGRTKRSVGYAAAHPRLSECSPGRFATLRCSALRRARSSVMSSGSWLCSRATAVTLRGDEHAAATRTRAPFEQVEHHHGSEKSSQDKERPRIDAEKHGTKILHARQRCGGHYTRLRNRKRHAGLRRRASGRLLVRRGRFALEISAAAAFSPACESSFLRRRNSLS